jgi:hypothetical protein
MIGLKVQYVKHLSLDINKKVVYYESAKEENDCTKKDAVEEPEGG